MCKFLKIAWSTYYYELKLKQDEKELENSIIKVFEASRNNYGTPKIKKELEKKRLFISRRKIGRIMKKFGLISNYTIKQYRVPKTTCNEAKTANELNRKFDN